jgi:hypothetical protein
VRFTGGAAQGGEIHAFGDGVGISTVGIYASSLQGESCDYGMELLGADNQVGAIIAFNNKYRGVLIEAYSTLVGSIAAVHSSGLTSGNSRPTGYALVIYGFSNRFSCPSIGIDASAGASGLQFGAAGYDHTLEEMNAVGRITGFNSPGAYGLEIGQSLAGSRIDMNVNGFANCVYIHDGVALAGNSLKFRGTSTNTVRWANGATGTFASPAVPVGVSGTNSVEFHVY